MGLGSGLGLDGVEQSEAEGDRGEDARGDIARKVAAVGRSALLGRVRVRAPLLGRVRVGVRVRVRVRVRVIPGLPT